MVLVSYYIQMAVIYNVFYITGEIKPTTFSLIKLSPKAISKHNVDMGTLRLSESYT